MKESLIGRRFGKLTVLSKALRKNYVACRCDCGTVKEIRASSLTKQKSPTRSCGCIQREIAKAIGSRTVRTNAAEQIGTNLAYHTNFQVIENQRPPKNNTSGVKGVSWNKERGKWEAYLNLHGKRIRLGRFADLSDAVKARQTAEETYYKPLIEEKSRVEKSEKLQISS